MGTNRYGFRGFLRAVSSDDQPGFNPESLAVEDTIVDYQVDHFPGWRPSEHISGHAIILGAMAMVRKLPIEDALGNALGNKDMCGYGVIAAAEDGRAGYHSFSDPLGASFASMRVRSLAERLYRSGELTQVPAVGTASCPVPSPVFINQTVRRARLEPRAEQSPNVMELHLLDKETAFTDVVFVAIADVDPANTRLGGNYLQTMEDVTLTEGFCYSLLRFDIIDYIWAGYECFGLTPNYASNTMTGSATL